MHRPAVRERHAWKLLSLACRGRLLVLHEGVCLMTAHTRLAVHEWIGLQLCHLIGVTGVARAPVSYTHLDVYKRQVQNIILRE